MKLVGHWSKSENDLTNLSVISEIGTKLKCVGVTRETRIIYLIVQRPWDNLCRKRQYPQKTTNSFVKTIMCTLLERLLPKDYMLMTNTCKVRKHCSAARTAMRHLSEAYIVGFDASSATISQNCFDTKYISSPFFLMPLYLSDKPPQIYLLLRIKGWRVPLSSENVLLCRLRHLPLVFTAWTWWLDWYSNAMAKLNVFTK